MTTLRITTTSVGLATAGLAFATYPALRPWGPESGARGALDLGSTAWLASHVLGMVGFVLLAFSLRAAANRTPWSWSGRPLREAEGRAWLAVALLLPFYGAEAYGLNAVGRYATTHADPSVLEIADSFRYEPVAFTTFGIGLLVLVLVGGRIAHGLWHAGALARTAGILTGLGLATYLPQFFTTPEVRVGHGILLGLGLLLMAATAHPTVARSTQAGATSTASSSAAATSTDVASVSPRISAS